MMNATPVTSSRINSSPKSDVSIRGHGASCLSISRIFGKGTKKPEARKAKGVYGICNAVLAYLLLAFSFTSANAYAASLTVGEGVVVKFGADAGLVVRDRLQMGRNVVVTSLRDDDAANQTSLQPGVPAPGDWKGITVEPSVASGDLAVDGLTIRYAGAEGAAALQLAQGDVLSFLTLSENLLGLRVTGTAQPILAGFSFLENRVGLEATDDSQPTLVGSEVRGSTNFGVRNLSSHVLPATNIWWGNISGPTDPIGNPAGTGDQVSANVDYIPFATSIPLIDCSVIVTDGNYAVSLQQVGVSLSCRNAVEYRLSPTSDFSGLPFLVIASAGEFPLSGQSGERNVYAEFRAQTGNTTVVMLPQFIQYTPGVPSVSILAPETEAIIMADTTIIASVIDAGQIDHVDFYVGSTLLSTDSVEPYEAIWPIASFANGTHTIRVVATNTLGLTGEKSQSVTLQQPIVDTEGPVISNLRYDNLPLANGGTLSATGMLSFNAADISEIATAQVLFDGVLVPGGLLLEHDYAVDLILDGVADGNHVITLSATDVFANGSERVVNVIVDTSAVGAPVVSITAPAASAQITGDAIVSASVNGAGVTRVDFYVDTTLIGSSTAEPYEATWSVQGFANGTHTIKAVATNVNAQTGEATIPVTLQVASTDVDGPIISNVRFAGQALVDGATLGAPGLLTFDVQDVSGVQSVSVLLDATSVSGGGLNNGHYSILLDFAAVSNGTHDITLNAVDAVGNPSTRLVQNLVVDIPAPPSPVILSPLDLSQVQLPSIAVSGTAQVGSQIQLYLNEAVTGGLINSGFNGSFSTTVTLPAEGTHQLSATAQNSRGISAASSPVMVTWLAPAPTVQITSPPANALISTDGPLTINASVIDAIGVSTAILEMDGIAVGAPVAAPPYSWSWTIDGSVAEGEHQLSVTATNSVGRTGTATRTVQVQHVQPPDPPVQTAYTGQVQSVSPPSSFGETPIVITGSAIDSSTNAAVPNALLKIVLQVGGFQRRISVSSDALGNFTYTFIPQASDSGVYTVSIIHPDQTTLPPQGNFTINRLGLNPTQYALQAARTIPSNIPIRLSASAGSGSNGVTLGAYASDQPSGSLPVGIAVTASAAVNVPAGGSVTVNVGFLAGNTSSTPASNGTVVLAAMDSGGNRRGLVVVNYTLREPLAALYPQPSSVQTGVARGQQVSATVGLSNRGLIPALGVQVSLDEFSGPGGAGAVPDWIYLASPANLGDIAVGANRDIQIVAAPTDGVVDGIYKLKILVNAEGINGFVWVSIAVTSSEQGSVLFLAKDIYTCLPDCVTTPGLAGASIRVQNEAVLTTTTLTTDAQGAAEFIDLPTGHYRYIATAPDHVSASGRLTVRPGISVTEDVFLDYELVTFEWSVTETTIQDQYDVTLAATYVTTIPAPVMLIEPASINLPNMQAGEELAGEITITNRGLVRADNLVWYPSLSDAYYEIEYLGVPPDTFDAHQSIRLPYRVTRTSVPLPGEESGSQNQSVPAKVSPMFATAKSGSSTTAGTCHGYSNPMRIEFSYECAAGIDRNGTGNAAFNKAYGQCSSGSGSGGGGGGGGGGGWGGGGGGSPIGTAMGGGLSCVPECPECSGGKPGF